jgi:hypothetical protein
VVTFLMTLRTSKYLRRLVFATLLAAAATFSGSAFGDPALACAAPREWDIGAYDACSTRVDDAWIAGAISEASHLDAYRECCEKTGGIWNNASNDCMAPPAAQAQEAERAPVEPAIQPPEATLWMPPQDPPMILYPGAITPGPASRG